MGEVNNQSLIRQQQTFAFNKSKPPVGESPQTQILDTLSDENKGQLTNAANVALKDHTSPEAQAFRNAGLTGDHVRNIADGKISKVGPLPSAYVNKLLVETKPQSEGTDPVVLGKVIDQSEENAGGLRDTRLIDSVWGDNTSAQTIKDEQGSFNVIADDNPVTDATVLGEQPNLNLGDGVVALGDAQIAKGQLKPGAENLVLNEASPEMGGVVSQQLLGITQAT